VDELIENACPVVLPLVMERFIARMEECITGT